MQTIQLSVREDISDKLLSFLSLLPKNSIKIEYPELSDEQIKAKLKKAEADIKKIEFTLSKMSKKSFWQDKSVEYLFYG